MSPEELDEARAKEAEERWRDMHPNDRKHTLVGTIAARLAREAAEARIAELEEALKPFAEVAWSELRLRGLLGDYETFDGIGVRHWRKAWFAFNAENTR